MPWPAAHLTRSSAREHPSSSNPSRRRSREHADPDLAGPQLVERAHTLARCRARGQDVVDDPHLAPCERAPPRRPLRGDRTAHVATPVDHQRVSLGAGRAGSSQEPRKLPRAALRSHPCQDGRDVPATLEETRRVRGDGDEDWPIDAVLRQRFADTPAEVTGEVHAPAVLGSEDVFARCRLGPVVPARQRPMEGGWMAATSRTLGPVGERVREARRAARTAWSREGVGERVGRAARTSDARSLAEQTTSRPDELRELEEEPHLGGTHPPSQGDGGSALRRRLRRSPLRWRGCAGDGS